MAYVQTRKNTDNPVLLLFPLPLYTNSRIYYEEDLEELGIGRVLDDVDEDLGRTVLNQAKTLASVQPELAFHFLLRFTEILKHIKICDLGKYVNVALEIYDSKGLNPAREFILGLDKHPLFIRYWGEGVSFGEVYGILLNYVHALGQDDLALEQGPCHYTDGLKIYLPGRNAVCPGKDSNFLLYKVMVTHKLGQITLGTYQPSLDTLAPAVQHLRKRYGARDHSDSLSDLGRFLQLFPDPLLAKDLFILSDTVRIETWMAHELPGLYRSLKTLKKQLALRREKKEKRPPRTEMMERLYRWYLMGAAEVSKDTRIWKNIHPALRALAEEKTTLEDVARTTVHIYSLMDELPEPYQPVEPVPYMGELRPEEAERGRQRRRRSTRLKFCQELAKLIGPRPDPEEVKIDIPSMEHETLGRKTPQRQEVPSHLLIDGSRVPVPEGMRKTIEEILEDLGALPGSYLAVADDMSGHFFRSLCRMPEEGEDVFQDRGRWSSCVFSENEEDVHAIDEWDYRRQGYRKRWALLRETEVASGGLEFAEETLKRHAGMIQTIKRQFERIRMERTQLRRQKDGDDIDLDALVEAFSDQQAGFNGTENVFTRLSRDKRDIATVFLMDMSGSTKGWINEMARSALLILSEAMVVLQDRFAIYGFSGRTRKRCELLRIKSIDEGYGDVVKGRIGNMRPLDYTRMGPPIRHVTEMLAGVEAGTRLLITLSDGKPDDYDGYNSDYGIEDTRQALIEARRQGIHPFCITIDKAEHSYLAHMYGEVNYVFIDDLTKLPCRVPEIYRKLTT